jgi:hypothetical protein
VSPVFLDCRAVPVHRGWEQAVAPRLSCVTSLARGHAR